jgi:hypothetical protein
MTTRTSTQTLIGSPSRDHGVVELGPMVNDVPAVTRLPLTICNTCVAVAVAEVSPHVQSEPDFTTIRNSSVRVMVRPGWLFREGTSTTTTVRGPPAGQGTVRFFQGSNVGEVPWLAKMSSQVLSATPGRPPAFTLSHHSKVQSLVALVLLQKLIRIVKSKACPFEMLLPVPLLGLRPAMVMNWGVLPTKRTLPIPTLVTQQQHFPHVATGGGAGVGAGVAGVLVSLPHIGLPLLQVGERPLQVDARPLH